MLQKLNSVRLGTIKALGKVFSVWTEPIPPESKESIERQKKHINDLSIAFEGASVSFEEAIMKMSVLTGYINSLYINSLYSDCTNCHHGRKHHAVDRRRKSGVGRCICGGCSAYRFDFVVYPISWNNFEWNNGTSSIYLKVVYEEYDGSFNVIYDDI